MKITDEISRLLSAVPKVCGAKPNLDILADTPLGEIFKKMANTPQNPIYHGEGDVFKHTILTLQMLSLLPEYDSLSDDGKTTVFLATLLHDIGKITCTRVQGSEIVSPHHASSGATMARELLWKDFGLAGSERARNIREAVCFIIKYHSYPPFAPTEKNAERKLLSIAANGELTPLFSMRLLCLMAKADILGRVSSDSDDYLQRVEYTRLLCEELGILDSPYCFKSTYSERAFFKGKLSFQGGEIYKSSFGEVVLLSALPGTGKDTYIKNNYPDLPMISLDEIREEIGVSAEEAQAPVITLAHERARQLLRKKTPFVWNATNITAELRAKQIGLFESYGASVRTVFLETEFSEGLYRNDNRERSVPPRVIERMLSKLQIPERQECEFVEWKADS